MHTYQSRLMVSYPKAWFVKESFTLLSPDGQANVIISSEPLSQGITSSQYALTQGELLAREFPRYRELSFEPAVVFDWGPGYVRHFSWVPPDGVEVTQIQCYYVEKARGYTATATAPSTAFPSYEALLRTLLVSARLGG